MRTCDCTIHEAHSANSTKITANIMGEQVQYELKIAGKHIACNSLSALLSVKLAGGDVQKAAMALGGIQPIEGRGSREVINLGDKNAPVTLINESYNASCIAMIAAFNVVSMIVPKRNGQRIAVLGDMLELGDIVTAGAELKSDSNGKGVVLAGSGSENIGAVALEAGVSGDLIKVRVHRGTRYT